MAKGIDGHLGRIREHYMNACDKHPVFVPSGTIMFYRDPDMVKEMLDNWRSQNDHGHETADSILCEELLEQELAIAQGDYVQAIEETYDCIAVLMRIVDLMERKQGI